MIRILVADDHAVVRRGLRQILDDTKDLRVTGEASSCEEVLSRIREQSYDAVVLDVSMPAGSSLGTLESIGRGNPRLPVLVLSVHPEEQYGLRFMRAGAAGYLTKESAPEELVRALRRVVAGRNYVSPRLSDILVRHLAPGAEHRHETLSNREYQVFARIVVGRTIKEIAADLGLSSKTISTYKTRLLRKIGIHNDVELVRYAISNGLLDTGSVARWDPPIDPTNPV